MALRPKVPTFPSPRNEPCPDAHFRGPSRVAFVTSTPLRISGGSGTYVGIRQLARSLEVQRIQLEMHAPTWCSPSLTAKWLLFNLLVAPRLRTGSHDRVVGFDLDGFHDGRAKPAPSVVCVKGVIADALRNERGVVRGLLRLQAACELLAVRRADVVVATSQYSRQRIVRPTVSRPATSPSSPSESIARRGRRRAESYGVVRAAARFLATVRSALEGWPGEPRGAPPAPAVALAGGRPWMPLSREGAGR